MTRNEKKTAIENMAERFMSISDLEGKSMAIMVMSAYAEGKAAGKVEERRRPGTERGGCNDRLTGHENNRQEPF